ncbi:MAG: hypothetical protein LVQ63_06710 [Thermoplasmatales archaeon]|nr:hypothetical protein [Thermoplasmatales archaeon]
MSVINMKVVLATIVVMLISTSGIYSSVSSTSSFNAAAPSEVLSPSVISVADANAFANSTNNLMEKLGKSINSSALSKEIVLDGGYITGSGFFSDLYSKGDSFYWTIAFNTSNQNGSTIYFLFPGSASTGSQPVEDFLQISFPLHIETGNHDTVSYYTYTNFSMPTGAYSNVTNTSQPWAGYEFNSPLTGNKTVNSASAWMDVPTLSYPPPLQNTTNVPFHYGEWVGISKGYYGNGGLLQTGVGIYNGSTDLIPSKYPLWWEDYPTNSPQPYSSSSYAYPGNIIWASAFDGYDASTEVPFYVNFTIYDRNTSIEYGINYDVKEYTYYAQFIVESNDVFELSQIAKLPEFSPSAKFEGGDVELGLNDTSYQITTLFNDSAYTNFTMMWDSGWWPNIYTKYTMQWNSFGDVQEYGYPTLTWNNSYV